jgi:hypothetical protein
MKHIYLRPMLEWRMELDHDWSMRTGALGKGLKKQLPPKIWSRKYLRGRLHLGKLKGVIPLKRSVGGFD